MKKGLTNPLYLQIQATDSLHVGGSQEWYPEKWQRMSGCGPTAAANLIWYLARSQAGMQSLCDVGDADRTHFLTLMEAMFTFVTPGKGGVNRADLFVKGVIGYGQVHGVALSAKVLEIPMMSRRRPTLAQMREFLLTALDGDKPVAFLNLSNGRLKNLEGWHWVTIMGLDTETMVAQISDQGRILDIALHTWLKTSALGGAMVYLTVEP